MILQEGQNGCFEGTRGKYRWYWRFFSMYGCGALNRIFLQVKSVIEVSCDAQLNINLC